jgi:ankyrin repeat protein
MGMTLMAPKVALSPLLAAASRGQAMAVQRLLELGAHANEDHPLYGTALHVAAQAGSAESVRLLLAAGIPADAKNKQGFTPRALIQAVRKQIEMSKDMIKMMPQMKKIYDQLAARLADLPEAGWDACEELLRQAGG